MAQITIGDVVLEQYPVNGNRTCGRVHPTIDCFFLNQIQYECPRDDDGILLCEGGGGRTCFLPTVEVVAMRLEGEL